jgi:murein DD-endopeptidase MepM/ murein hydrolase activator NlpD
MEPARVSLRRIASLLLVLLALGWAGTLAWRHAPPMLRALPEIYRLARLPPALEVPVPVDGVRLRAIADTWGAARGAGRRHKGTDIFAPRGTPVRSATRGVVVRIGQTGIGGRQVWVLGPGQERHYYAHLDAWAAGLHEGQPVAAGDLLGEVGDSGNARGTPPHLHYGIYGDGGARNPHARLRDAFTQVESGPASPAR